MSRIIAVYRFAAAPDEADARAEALAVEQSVEISVGAITDRFVLEETLARVESVRDLGGGRFEARIALGAATVGAEAGQLFNMLYGNVSLLPDVTLDEIELPADVLSAFAGPALGVDGLRRLCDAPERPLTLSNLKPQGLDAKALARLAAQLAAGGVDIIKDDHGLADQRYSPFAERTPRIAEAVERASRRRSPSRYFSHLTGDLDQLRERLEIVRGCGLKGALILPMLLGPSTVQTLRRENPDLALLAHPSYGGATRIAPAVLMGALFRLLGADATVFPGFGGRFGPSRETSHQIAHYARRPWGGLKPTLPAPAGGMRRERIGELIAFYGRDLLLFLGGSLLASPGDLASAAREFVDAAEALSEPLSRLSLT